MVATLDLTTSRRGSLGPHNRRARRVGGALDQLVSSKGVPEDIAEVVPDGAVPQSIGENGLRLAREQAISLAGDLEGATAGLGVPGETLRVGFALPDGAAGGQLAAN